MPKRIQRKRTKGWKMPEGAVSVARPSLWGNPYKVGEHGTVEECVAKHRALIEKHRQVCPGLLAELRGRDLACFCPLDQPCHADTLLELANP